MDAWLPDHTGFTPASFDSFTLGRKNYPYYSENDEVKLEVLDLKNVPSIYGKFIPNFRLKKNSFITFRMFLSMFIGELIDELRFKIKVIKE